MRWKQFGQALRAEERTLFEEMLNTCLIYASAGGFASRPILTEPMLMSILFSHHKALKQLLKRLDRLEKNDSNKKGKTTESVENIE